MFIPPRCPNLTCPQHLRPEPGFFRRRGYYRPLCRPEGVPRFRCTTCKRGFSRQTFRHDWHDHRPDWNVALFMLLYGIVWVSLILIYFTEVRKARLVEHRVTERPAT